MDIKRVAIDAVNETIVMTVVHMDYKGQVAKRINEKMPLATVKGFRKGAVPKDLVEKQYGKAIKQEEVQKVVDLALERFVQSERLNLLGTPLPKVNENFSWDAEELVFEFEIGLVPNFTLDLEGKNDIVKYVVKADDKLIDGQVARIQKQFGTAIPQEVVVADSDITGTFANEEAGINNATTISLDMFKDKATADKFIGKKVGDVVTVNTNGLFEDAHQLMDVMKIGHDDVHTIAVDVDFTIEAINGSELAELNQELFDKLFGAGNVATLEELKAKIKEDAETQFAQQADQKLLADVQDFLIESTKFDLPAEFLKKWLQTVGEKKLTPEEAEVEYARSERGLRFQLIEGRAMATNEIKVTFEDLKSFTTKNIRQQMAQFGQTNPTDEEVQGIVARVLSNQDEVKRLSDQVVGEKMLDLFKEKANPTTKEVTYEEFIAASYGE
ncbi:trigger factor [Flavobacterium sp. I-SCBP12n]|uniref:Trigger factor n=2 Tax=Flavobacterium TaxID=237 RepID=A0A9X2BLT4_9FLAO|nr:MULTISPECIES: trigger factor [Flavobacterium]MBP4140725.1 trigger factor [Flavobacterium flabelliforme]MCK8142133.1 trigger factor [Flavobacterium pygoscelis]